MADPVTFSNYSINEVENQSIHTKTLDGNYKQAEISPEEKKAYLCEVKKLAENVSCGDENYCQWITKNFGKTKGQDFMVHLFYKADKKDPTKPQKRPVFAVKVKTDKTPIFEKKINAQPDKKVSLPQVCEDAKDCVIPRVWTDDMDDCVPPKPHKLDFVPLSTDIDVDAVKKATTTRVKLTFCVRDEAVGQVAFALQSIGLTNYFEHGCIINCYQNEKNLNFCQNMGFKKLELGLYFNQPKYLEQNPQNPRLKRVCASLSKINLRFLPQFEYLDLGKNCRDAVRNLVMIPLIEKFYAENPHLVTSEVRRELGSQSCCYELARRTTGFFYTYSRKGNDDWITEHEAVKILIGKQMVRFNGSVAGNVLTPGGA